MISLKNIYKVFGHNEQQVTELAKNKMSKKDILLKTGHTLALCDINLQINEGEFFMVMGLSGSGKSTLIRHFNRLIDPSSGEIEIFGQDILKLNGKALRDFRQKYMSMVFQHYALLPHWKVIDNVSFGLKAQNIPQKEARKKAAHYLEQVGLEQYHDKYPDELSGGMKQRVGLARALCVESPILLLDEPFSGLDPIIRYEMQHFMMELQKKLNKTLVFITHDLDEAITMGDRIAILQGGRLIQCAAPSEIIESPANEFIRKFTLHYLQAKSLPTKQAQAKEQAQEQAKS